MGTNSALSRREILRLGAAAAAAVGTAAVSASPARASTTDEGRTVLAAGTDAGGYEVLANAYGFSVDIPGALNASKNIFEFTIDDLDFSGDESTASLTATLRAALTPNGKGDLTTWFEQARVSKNVRKTIAVTLFKSDRTPGRAYDLVDCSPVLLDGANFDTSSTVQTETLRVKVGRIEFKT